MECKLIIGIYRSTHKKPVKVRHGISGVQMRFKIYANCGPGDNPAQSDVCGHIGGKEIIHAENVWLMDHR